MGRVLPSSLLDQIEQEIGSNRTLLLVNVHDLASAVHPPRVFLVDWNGAIMPHPDLLWSDGIHARPDGATLYTNLIAAALAG